MNRVFIGFYSCYFFCLQWHGQNNRTGRSLVAGEMKPLQGLQGADFRRQGGELVKGKVEGFEVRERCYKRGGERSHRVAQLFAFLGTLEIWLVADRLRMAEPEPKWTV